MTDPGQRLRGAIVGYGFISANGHVPAYAEAKDRFDIVAVADVCPARRELAKNALPHARIYEDHASLLLGEHGRIDFVDITTPPSEHARIARAALARGLHVLCEKPVATSTEDMRAMIADAREAKRVLFPSHNYKHAPVIKAVRQILDTGAIGAVKLVTLQTFRNTHAKGVREWRPDWRREKRFSGGGIAMDHGAHTFYLAFDWLGSYPTAITAKMSTLGDFDTEDNFSCAITFPTGLATAELTWTAGVRKVIYTIHGEQGAIRVEDDDIELTRMTKGEAGAPATFETRREQISSDWKDASHVTWFGSLFAQFAQAIETNEYVGQEVENALRCIELITTAYASAAEGSRELALPAMRTRARRSM
jgi:predicted dehydrogenase